MQVATCKSSETGASHHLRTASAKARMKARETGTSWEEISKQIPFLAPVAASHHVHRQELKMPMGLARPRMLARVEEGEQPAAALFPHFQACIRSFDIVLLKHVRLGFVTLGRKYEMLGNDGEFVKDENMRGAIAGKICNEEVFRWVDEGRLLRGFVIVLRLLRERRAPSKLELSGS